MSHSSGFSVPPSGCCAPPPLDPLLTTPCKISPLFPRAYKPWERCPSPHFPLSFCSSLYNRLQGCRTSGPAGTFGETSLVDWYCSRLSGLAVVWTINCNWPGGSSLDQLETVWHGDIKLFVVVCRGQLIVWCGIPPIDYNLVDGRIWLWLRLWFSRR